MSTVLEMEKLVLDTILNRRSVSALEAPAPTAQQLELILAAATTVPDHGQLRPYRFVVVEGEGRARFGSALASAALEEKPELPAPIFEKVRMKAFAAPMCIVLIASPRPGAKIAEWEQVATAACAGYAITLAAHNLGVGAVWKSTAFQDGQELKELLGLSGNERTLGWVNLGTSARPGSPEPRPMPDLGSLTTRLSGSSRTPYQAGR